MGKRRDSGRTNVAWSWGSLELGQSRLKRSEASVVAKSSSWPGTKKLLGCWRFCEPTNGSVPLHALKSRHYSINEVKRRSTKHKPGGERNTFTAQNGSCKRESCLRGVDRSLGRGPNC